MAAIGEVIQAKLSRYNIDLTEAELEVAISEQGLVSSDPYTSEVSTKTLKVIAGVLPELLLAPDITEGGYSIKYDKTAVLAYYKMLCADLGLPDKVSPQPKIRSKSCIW